MTDLVQPVAGAARPHLAAAREETERRGHASQVEFAHGDFVAIADRVPAADVVTLDRVICCYHDMESLVRRSAERARRLYGAVYPRELRWMRIGIATITSCSGSSGVPSDRSCTNRPPSTPFCGTQGSSAGPCAER